MMGGMPSRWAATSNDTRVRVDGLSNRQATAVPWRAAVHQVGPSFISSARSSSALSCVAVRSAIRSRSDGVVVVIAVVVVIGVAVMVVSSLERVALDRAGHAARPSAAAPQLGAGDGDDLDAGVAQAGVGVDVALVGHDDAGRDRQHVVAVVPLLAFGLVAVAAGLEDPQARQLEQADRSPW